MPTDNDPTGSQPRSTLEEVAEIVGRNARAALSDVLRAINAYAQDNKGTAARQLDDYADAASKAAGALGARNNDLGARLLGEAADHMSRASERVAQASADDIADGLESAARRNPAAFAAGAVLAGVALGYLLKAAASERAGQGPSRLPAPSPAADASASPPPESTP